MIFRLFLLSTVLLGCGNLQNDPIVVDIGDVEVRHTFDISEIEKYFETYCRKLYPNGSQLLIDECVAEQVIDFIHVVGAQ